LWVADFTYVATWAGFVYVAFVLDVHSRMIVGWKADRTMRADLVTDTLDMAAWTRGRAGVTDLTGLIHHTDAGSQYTSIAFTERLAALGMRASMAMPSALVTSAAVGEESIDQPTTRRE
jgi:putative transposase